MSRFASPLRADELLQATLRHAGRNDFHDLSFLPALERLVEACNEEASLSPMGLHAARLDFLRCLRNVLRLDAVEATVPQIRSRPIEAPVFITAMPRSGTTFLHRLILRDTKAAAPRLHQLVFPTAPTAGGAAVLVKSWVCLQLTLFRLFAPELHALHPLSVSAPEECTDIIAHVFKSLRFDSIYRVPSYRAWLQRTGLLDGYRFHKRFLQHLDAREPGRRWVLKSPDHIFALGELLKVYPDAHLVFVHRDPLRVLGSVTKLTEVLRRPFSRNIDRVEIGREVSAAWLEGARRMRELAASGTRVLHLHYVDIVRDPLDAVQAVYEHCNLPFTEEAQERMWRSLQPSRRIQRRRRYELAEYGLDRGTLREQFTSYVKAFDVDLEDEDSVLEDRRVVSFQHG